MGHHGDGSSQAQLVELLSAGGMIKTARVKAAMAAVDRSHFVSVRGSGTSDSERDNAHPSLSLIGGNRYGDFAAPSVGAAEVYANKPLTIGCATTISTPQMHALV